MPLPAAAAVYAAVVSSLPAAAPLIGATAVSFAIIATHDPNKLEEAVLKGRPEAAAECVQKNVTALNTRLLAEVQPLHGTEVMAVLLRRGIAGDVVTDITLHESGSGSRAEFRPLTAPQNQPDVLTKIIAGC